MPNIINQEKLLQFISSDVITKFNQQRLLKLQELDILKIIKRKNPYLYKAKSLDTPEAIVRSIIDAFLSSHEETVFGDRMEALAIYVCKEVFNGIKLPQNTNGNPDIKFTRDGITYYVEVKSGPNWGNSSQIGKLKINFKRIRQELINTGEDLNNYSMINGCVYGQVNSVQSSDSDPQKHYTKICGQVFWELISGSMSFYTDIITPLGIEAEKKDDSYKEAYNTLIIKSSIEFCNTFVEDNKVNWKKIIEYTSENLK